VIDSLRAFFFGRRISKVIAEFTKQYSDISVPTLLLDTGRARRNITRMADKAAANQVRFRPHFKTHQSAAVGEWFRDVGVTAITVSSVEMARYFAAYGWSDITIAFPVNVREIDKINRLAQQVRLHLLVENQAAVNFLTQRLTEAVGIWLEIDAGYHRSGVHWDDGSTLAILAQQIMACDRMALQGLLTHDGATYTTHSHDELAAQYGQTVRRLDQARAWLMEHSFLGLELSVGDTPACSILDDLGQIDEMRPGNFVFYDWMQVQIGSCTADDIAVIVACPVVSIHPERNELILYGGAVHLSKENLRRQDGQSIFGAVVLLDAHGWSAPLQDVWVRSLSQEHGVVYAEDAAFVELVKHVEVGGLLGVAPVHSCLTADLLKQYRTLDGEILSMAPIPCTVAQA
jgi:D-serine deaminase-like pyridoxal phosphate-dependent protein